MNLRSILFTATILVSAVFISCGQAQSPAKADLPLVTKPINYNAWQEEAKTNIRLLPKYGNLPKNEQQKEADNKLISRYEKQEGTRHKGSELLINQGFKYLYNGDIKTAMYRFNQAWLLDSTNTDIYWGYGSVYFYLKQYQLAMEQYDEGLRINPENSKIITDKATLHMIAYQMNNEASKLKEAITLFNKSYALDQKNQNTLFKLSVSYFLDNNCKKARLYYDECVKLGGEPITPEYTQALNEKCKD
ncbi:tetratricopeptide repeat protein [Pedobacter ginsengisoli]|uniref:tetratricopeptide repeat protein n=1 Tax=Pedobacter ginsengisoli TaxID=363852 RepID=UPI00254BBFFA|nr:tetratricopeptide repeat protein [Pedobacter ginsengisoli]